MSEDVNDVKVPTRLGDLHDTIRVLQDSRAMILGLTSERDAALARVAELEAAVKEASAVLRSDGPTCVVCGIGSGGHRGNCPIHTLRAALTAKEPRDE